MRSHSFHGPTRNPVDASLVAGGSSSGSAAAVAYGGCDIALGSDTGGSVRLPAACCGVVGVKPSYGRVSRHGLIAYASSLDTVGVFARTVADASSALAAIEGPDGHDATAVAFSVSAAPDADAFGDADLAGMRVGLPREFFTAEVERDVLDAWGKSCELPRRRGLRCVHDVAAQRQGRASGLLRDRNRGGIL